MIVEQVSGSAWAECPNGVESALSVPELFADPDFVDYVNASNVMSWHDKKGPIGPDDWADVVVFVDPSLSGEGTDSEIPYWECIVDKLRTAVGGYDPQMREHYVVVLTNV
ncbi:hypothetical protein [Pseudomonas aeruginosa]|nr:hypothetical protein [Pseudomonas aeruginosa]MBD1300165.1 hypothetical protein [Pseudomonas aeruginosa]MBD1340852.1 hypothetical protein [Pseudomonas aeruginosa]RQC70801.1 hypothetical protein IPC353_28335 [Pseudomonas aeruginosa]